MLTTEINGKKVELYDNIEELPIYRFHKYNKFLLLDASLGSNLQDLVTRVEKAKRYIPVDPALAQIELNNLQQGMHLVAEEISPQHLAFATLVHSIEGKVIEGHTDDTFKKILEELKEAPKGLVSRLLESIKKKIDEQLDAFFPGLRENAKEKQMYDLLKKKTMLILTAIEKDEAENSEDVLRTENEMLMLSKPLRLDSEKNAELEYDKEFNNSVIAIKQNLNLDAKTLSVFEFYNSLNYIKKNGTR